MVSSAASTTAAQPTLEEAYLVTAAQIAAASGKSKTHFMNANARRTNKDLGALTGLKGIGFHMVELEPGRDASEHHVHHHEDECIYILEGTATAFIGDEAFDVCPGDFIGYRKGGRSHSIRNTGTTILRCIVVGERAPHDVGDYPRKGKRIYRNANMEWAIVDHEALASLR